MAFECFRIPSELISVRSSAADGETPVGGLTCAASVCPTAAVVRGRLRPAASVQGGGCNAEEATD